MGLDQFRLALARHRRLAVDASVFIYHLEANPRYAPLADLVFAWIERPGNFTFTSTITITELLVAPYRQSNQQRVDEFYALLSTYPRLTWVPLDLEIAASAARLRALHGLRTPDAIQAATAEHSRAPLFVTNDPAFARVPSFSAQLLDKFV